MIPLLLGSALSVELPIYVGVAIPPRALERALAEADRLFDAGGIRFQWRLSPGEPLSAIVPRGPTPAATDCPALRADLAADSKGCRSAGCGLSFSAPCSAPAVIVVLGRPERAVISGCSRNLHDHRLGHTHLGARRVTLWTEQVARAVEGSWGRKNPPRVDESTLGTALGRVLAHELGHLFLRLDGHRENGLMKPSFSHRALVGKSDRSFRLSEEDLERVRAAITRLQVTT
jgi:hypothetical protein